MENELDGTLVLVNPDFERDPHGRNGQVGSVKYIDPLLDEVLVTFDDQQNELYASDALLVLKKPGEVYQNALVHLRDMEASDFKTLLKINLAQETNDPQQLRNAFMFAQASDKVRQYSLEPLESRLHPELKLSEGFQRPPVISR